MRDATDDIGLTYCDNNECPCLKAWLEEQDRQNRHLTELLEQFKADHPHEYEIGAYRYNSDGDCYVIYDVEFYELLDKA